MVFGEEGKGLSTEDLLRCDYLVTLPTWEGYPITNLSHAVHTLTYELHRNRVLSSQGKDKALQYRSIESYLPEHDSSA